MRTIGVVVPARNDSQDLPIAINSILRQAGVKIDSVVISVGPSADDTEGVAQALAAAHSQITTVRNPTGRTAAALNLAIDALATDVVVRVDARSVLPDTYILDAVTALQETGAANVGAIQKPVGHSLTERAIAAAMSSVFGTGGAAYRGAQERQKVDTAYLGAFCREALVDVGGYDESFTRNQDAELNLRLNRAGHDVWLEPKMVVQYRPRPTLGRLASQYWQYGWWRQRTARKHKGSLRSRQLIPPALVFVLVASLALALTSAWWLLLPLLYVTAMLVVGLIEGGGGLRQRCIAAAALVTMHLAWGMGFVASSFVRPSARGDK